MHHSPHIQRTQPTVQPTTARALGATGMSGTGVSSTTWSNRSGASWQGGWSNTSTTKKRSARHLGIAAT